MTNNDQAATLRLLALNTMKEFYSRVDSTEILVEATESGDASAESSLPVTYESKSDDDKKPLTTDAAVSELAPPENNIGLLIYYPC